MYNDTELIPVTTTFCSLLCADESICGGNNGAISIYTMFNIYGVNNLTVTTVDFAGNSVSSALDNNTLVTEEVPTYINTYINTYRYPASSPVPISTLTRTSTP